VGVACFERGTDVPSVSLLLSLWDNDADGRREEVRCARMGLEKEFEERSVTGFEMCGVTVGAATTLESGLFIANVCLRTLCGEEPSSDLPSCVDPVRAAEPRSDAEVPPLASPLLALCIEELEDVGGVG
jgi:hypothetical protein